MNRPTCETCAYFHISEFECRRHPPAVFLEPPTTYQTVWPTVHANAWCGRHDRFEVYLKWQRLKEGAADLEKIREDMV